MFCKYCGKELADTAKFCSRCGKRIIVKLKVKPVTEKKKFCENCGEPLVDGAKFCLACGTSVFASNSTAPANQNQVQDTNRISQFGTTMSQKESVSEEKPNIEKDDANKNGKGIRVAIGIIIGVLLLAILIGVDLERKKPWTAHGVFNLDVLNAKPETCITNDGTKVVINCYNISEADLEKLWNSIRGNSKDVSLIYAGSTFYPFEPEYGKIEDYPETTQSLMRKYDILCSQVYGSYIFTCLINRRTGQVMAF